MTAIERTAYGTLDEFVNHIRMQVRTRDQLTTMYLKRIRLLHNNAKKRLPALHDRHRAVMGNIQ